MSLTENTQTDQDDDLKLPSEMDVLKDRATLMGVEFSNNIGLDTLKKRIADKLAENQAPATAKDDSPVTAQVNALTGEDPAVPVKRLTLRQYMLNEQTKLVRLRITCLDPKKKDLPGEIFTVANESLGTIRKYVPFGEATDDGYHVPFCIYTMMKGRLFLNIRTYKDKKNNNQIKIEQNWAREFALEVLPPLTMEELKTLSASQAAAGGL